MRFWKKNKKTYALILVLSIYSNNNFSYIPQRDITEGGFRRVVALKDLDPQLKVSIAVGGWAEGGHKFSQMASVASRRQVFIRSIVRGSIVLIWLEKIVINVL